MYADLVISALGNVVLLRRLHSGKRTSLSPQASPSLLKMTKRKSSKAERETRASFSYPSLHEDISNAVSDHIDSIWFNPNGSNKSCNNKYCTKVMGRFKCTNNDCSNHGWGSKTVAILIRGYPGNGYDAVVFNQHCKSCKKLGTFTLDQPSYVQRVSYRLQKWAGVQTEDQPYDERKGPPHMRELCEGCKQGCCLMPFA